MVVATAVVTATALAFVLVHNSQQTAPAGPTVGERIEARKAERAGLQARADGKSRLELLGPLRVASLLSDALAVRVEGEGERAFERLPTAWRQAFAELDALNLALRDALDRPSPGAGSAVRAAARRAERALDQLAVGSELPLVLSFTPHFIAPRRATGELTLEPRTGNAAPAEGALRLESVGSRPAGSAQPTIPRYAPSFAASREPDPAVAVEIVGLHLSARGMAPALTVGSWRGEGETSAERLRFSVPRSAFTTGGTRTTLVAATLAIRRDGRTLLFELPFLVLPDRLGSMALDQKIRNTVPESNALVSPEILARAEVGETRSVNRCFDPPEGWRFDREHSRVVVVERLGWVDDVSDPTMNAGTVEFTDGKPGQICVTVVAKPAAKTARTATIGRFEAALLHDKTEDQIVQSGVWALEWREPVRARIEPNAAAWRLYVRLFDEVDREFDDEVHDLPFLRIAVEDDGLGDGGRTLILTPDPSAEP
jgi:hypothetical protein